MTAALRIISAEHSSLWRLLSLLDGLRQELDRTDPQLIQSVFDYIDSYSDRMHHPKEDQYLFRLLRARAPEAEALLDELQAEHRRGHELMPTLRAELAALPASRAALAQSLGDYVAMEREHIRKEEIKIMPLARQRLTADDWAEIDRAFAENNDPLFGDAARREFSALRSRIVNIAPPPYGLGMQDAPVTLTKAEPHPTAARLLLEVTRLTSHYGRIQALRDINLRVNEGELVALVGANGAGKTTLLRSISGLQPVSGGQIVFQGQDITRLRADKRVALGICQSPEGRQVFGPLSVEDNLRLGGYTRQDKAGIASDLARIYELFPILREKRKLPAGTLSGGQQQMLAMGRALMGQPKLLLLDEPSLGLAPLLVEEIFNVVKELKSRGMTIFMVEQNAHAALSIADTGYVIETGETVLSDKGPLLLENERVKAAYLGM